MFSKPLTLSVGEGVGGVMVVLVGTDFLESSLALGQ